MEQNGQSHYLDNLILGYLAKDWMTEIKGRILKCGATSYSLDT